MSAGFAWGNGASFEEGLKQGGQGALMGAGIGAITGAAAGVRYAHDNKVDPWTGKEKGPFSVYEGKDANFDTRYVGITERNPDVRFNEHHNSHGTGKESLDYRVKASGLSKFEARRMEQQLINKYGFGKNGGQLYNKINSISPKYWDKYGIKY